MMASNIEMGLDPQDIGTATTEARKVTIPVSTDNTNAPGKDTNTASSAAQATDKISKAKPDKKKLATNGDTKRARAKSKKGKKGVMTSDSSSSGSGDDLESVSSSGDSSVTGSDDDTSEENVVKKKRVLKEKKKLASQKGNAKVKSSKKSKKRTKSKLKRIESESDDVSDTGSSDESDSEAEDEDNDDLGRGHSKKTGHDQLLLLQTQVQNLQYQLQRQNASLGIGGSTAALGSAGVGMGSLGTGPGGNALAMSNLATHGLVGGVGNVQSNRFIDQDLGIPGRGHVPPIRRGVRAQLAGLSRGNTGFDEDPYNYEGSHSRSKSKGKGKSSRDTKTARLEFKRVDQVWDSKIHNYKLQDTAENTSGSQYSEFLFHVRRTFDWEGKYKATIVDIKSKPLREALQEVMGAIKGVSLVEETPKLDPNMLFLYLEDLREHLKSLKGFEPDAKTSKERKRMEKWNESKRRHLKVLIRYLDKDYSHIKKSLYPLLENGLITFDLLWALWKPNTLAYTTTYGTPDEARVFKVEMADKHYSIMKGDFYYIEGKYFEYDGKTFGYGSLAEEMGDFRGARKITSLSCYPLNYHKEEAQIRKDLIERGKKFVGLAGVNYKSHQGLAYYKKKKSIIKVNINGRIMVDPAIHRRNNPNYPISVVRPKDHDVLTDDEASDDEEGGCGCASDSGDVGHGGGGSAVKELIEREDKEKTVRKMVRNKNGDIEFIEVPEEDVENFAPNEQLDKLASQNDKDTQGDRQGSRDAKTPSESKPDIPEFSDEEYLIASPVVLGFAFAEKLWLEFTVSGVKEISWNEHAYDSLVLEAKTKEIVQALVESHKYHPAESIDDVIQGKGKGLVAVLHGPPGTGKTLTAEGISELLKCPLYSVSAGDLGTDSRYLEAELQKTLDICHAWGAILLLDEADVFLEKRNMADIHRNALVSIFLRQLEYFQGILFLTTNRVETFDDAFQSRIHIALKYDELDTKAKKAIFKIFVERVRALEKVDSMPFSEEDYNTLARYSLNGRQIKNTVRTAQALAVNKGEPLNMRHIREYLDVLMSFERDLKGGTGYTDAMRSYF